MDFLIKSIGTSNTIFNTFFVRNYFQVFFLFLVWIIPDSSFSHLLTFSSKSGPTFLSHDHCCPLLLSIGEPSCLSVCSCLLAAMMFKKFQMMEPHSGEVLNSSAAKIIVLWTLNLNKRITDTQWLCWLNWISIKWRIRLVRKLLVLTDYGTQDTA